MALTKDQKKAQVADLRDDLKKAQSLAFMHYRGLSVSEVDELRGKMLEKKAKMRVAKKTLYNIAAKEEGYPEVPEGAFGDQPIAFVFSFEDMVSGAKVAFEFGKSHDAVELIGGVLDGKVLSKEEAVDLAKMLSREETLAKFAAMLRAPLGNFAGMCGGTLGSFARAVKEVAEKGGLGEDSGSEEEKTAEEETPKEEVSKEEDKKTEETKQEDEETTTPDAPESTETPESSDS